MQLLWTVFCPQRWIEQQDDMFCFVSVRLHLEVCEEEGQNKIKQQQQRAEEQEKEGSVVHLSGSTLMCLRSMLNPICLLTSMSYFKAASVGAV